jgi:hypothetical protein
VTLRTVFRDFVGALFKFHLHTACKESERGEGALRRRLDANIAIGVESSLFWKERCLSLPEFCGCATLYQSRLALLDIALAKHQRRAGEHTHLRRRGNLPLAHRWAKADVASREPVKDIESREGTVGGDQERAFALLLQRRHPAALGDDHGMVLHLAQC